MLSEQKSVAFELSEKLQTIENLKKQVDEQVKEKNHYEEELK